MTDALDLQPAALAEISCAVRERGLAPVARALGVPANSLASALAGRARHGTRLLIAMRLRQLGSATRGGGIVGGTTL